MFSYTVRCTFTDAEVVGRWMNWLRDKHIQDVIDAGAVGAEVFKMNNTETYELRYQFASQADFEKYELEHAPGLREEGLAEFPLELGLEYARTTGESLLKIGS